MNQPTIQDALVYVILRAQAGARRPQDASVSAETIADFSGGLLNVHAAELYAERLAERGVAVRLTTCRKKDVSYSIPALRTINDYELSLRATASTLKEILSWELN